MLGRDGKSLLFLWFSLLVLEANKHGQEDQERLNILCMEDSKVTLGVCAQSDSPVTFEALSASLVLIVGFMGDPSDSHLTHI